MKFKIVQGTIEVKLNLIFEKTSATETLMKEELVESMNSVSADKGLFADKRCQQNIDFYFFMVVKFFSQSTSRNL